MNQLQILSSLEIGLIYALAAIGIYISFRILDFPDLTVDGSFTLGAAVSATLIIHDYSPLLALIIAALSGAVAGSVTGYLNVKWQILSLLASILTMTALYSVNLRIMGKPNITILNENILFICNSVIITCLLIVSLVILVLNRFFATEFGLSIRGAGINPMLSLTYGIKVNRVKIIALALSNALVSVSGALFAQSQGFADIAMGNGTIIAGLAAIMIGEALIKSNKIFISLIACMVGSVIYRLVIGLALNASYIGLEASDLNLLTAVIILFSLTLPKLKR